MGLLRQFSTVQLYCYWVIGLISEETNLFIQTQNQNHKSYHHGMFSIVIVFGFAWVTVTPVSQVANFACQQWTNILFFNIGWKFDRHLQYGECALIPNNASCVKKT